MTKKSFDLVIIGSGPGGYVAAIRSAQRGLSTCLIEASQTGGTCLNRGCIPSKALIAGAELLHEIRGAEQHGIKIGSLSFDYSLMAKRKDKIVDQIRKNLEGLIKSNKITLLRGYAKFISPHQLKVLGEDECFIEATQIIIATGSEPREIPSLPFDHKLVHNSTSLLEMTSLPDSMLIVGGGVIGCEFASLYNELGVDVTIVELLPSILSTEGLAIGQIMSTALQKKGIKIYTSTLVKTIERKKDHIIAHLDKNGESIKASSSLVSIGRKFNSDNLGLEHTGVVVNYDGSIATNARMQTSVPHIYAIGDVTGKWILAHVASHQGLVAADNAAGHPAIMEYNVIPSVIFTHPEVASVGYTLEKAQKEGYDAIVGTFPFQALGRAQATGHTEGFAQIVVVKSTGQILGAQVIGESASSLIAEMAVAIKGELTVDSIHETIHAHPTMAESWMEAASLASGLPLHLPPKAQK